MAMSNQRDMKKPPPLNQIHHTKINQRQDSSISSDSYSISSPGYNSKTMEAPLLRMKKSKNIQNSSNFVMSHLGKRNSSNNDDDDEAKRQESSISSESISQTSSSSGPLLANALKLNCEFCLFHTQLHYAHAISDDLDILSISLSQLDKPSFRSSQPDEVVKDDVGGAVQSAAAIIKSSSTPASLQTIVRFSNGSNMSLQHKVSLRQ